jgi:hypothetical protein
MLISAIGWLIIIILDVLLRFLGMMPAAWIVPSKILISMTLLLSSLHLTSLAVVHYWIVGHRLRGWIKLIVTLILTNVLFFVGRDFLGDLFINWGWIEGKRLFSYGVLIINIISGMSFSLGSLVRQKLRAEATPE